MPILGGVAAAMLSVACSSPRPQGAATPEAALPVTTAVVQAADLSDGFETGGIVQARTTAAVAARVVAPVLEVRVAPGDRVRAGQTLIVLDGGEVDAHARAAVAASSAAADGSAAAQADQESAEAARILAQATYDRVATLHAKRSATSHELDQATAALRAAEGRARAAVARVKEAASSLDRASAVRDAAAVTASYLRLVAPFDGVVTEKMVEPGNMVAPAEPLLRIEDTRGFRVDVRLDESRAAGLVTGTKVDVVVSAEPAAPAVEGTITEIGRAVDADLRASLVKVGLPGALSGLRSGTFARVRFPGPSRQALSVPASAVVTQGQITSVFVVERGLAKLRLVRLRGREVLAGLAAGDVVIVSPPAGLADGRAVTAGGAR